jgi:FAD/FMN-containing dehydrogenase
MKEKPKLVMTKIENNVGYDLIQLIIGSEGTLAVITKATLRLYPKFGATATIILPFTNRNDAMSTVQRILKEAGIAVYVYLMFGTWGVMTGSQSLIDISYLLLNPYVDVAIGIIFMVLSNSLVS